MTDRWETWARNCLASGSIVPPPSDCRRQMSNMAQTILTVLGIVVGVGLAAILYPLVK